MSADVQQASLSNSASENSLFDKYGRCEPTGLTEAAHTQSRHYFSLLQPEISYAESYARLNASFDIAGMISEQEFEQRANTIIEQIKQDNELRAMLNGVHVPFILPKADYSDIGSAMDDIYLPAVNKSFSEFFPEHEFTNHFSNSLSGRFNVAKNSRHENLIDAMKGDVVVGIYFPCLLEYSVPAARERIMSLPEACMLAGGYDTAAAFVAAPDLLLRKDGYPPLLWLSGLDSTTDNAEFHFEAYGYDLTFNRRAHLDQVAEYWASALVVLG